MKKVLLLLMACLATLPLSTFAAETTNDVVIESGVESMKLAIPC